MQTADHGSTLRNDIHCRTGDSDPQRGFTLVELLVVIAIIGILVALLMPAIQAAREAARRAQCQNNLKQNMTALHLHHDTYNEFPAGHEVYYPDDPQPSVLPNHTNHSYVPYILPYLEEQAIFDEYNFDIPWNAGRNALFTVHVSQAVDLPMQLCPSSDHMSRGQGDYAAINGPNGATYNTYPERGMDLGRSDSWRTYVDPATKRKIVGQYAAGFFPAVGPGWGNTRVRIKDITDGTQYTIALGEDAGRTDSARYWAYAENGFAHHHPPINDPNDRNNELYSEHPNGLNIGMADASIRFLHESTSQKIIDFMATRAGGEGLHGQF